MPKSADTEDAVKGHRAKNEPTNEGDSRDHSKVDDEKVNVEKDLGSNTAE
jgi:hypothetical protein